MTNCCSTSCTKGREHLVGVEPHMLACANAWNSASLRVFINAADRQAQGNGQYFGSNQVGCLRLTRLRFGRYKRSQRRVIGLAGQFQGADAWQRNDDEVSQDDALRTGASYRPSKPLEPRAAALPQRLSQVLRHIQRAQERRSVLSGADIARRLIAATRTFWAAPEGSKPDQLSLQSPISFAFGAVRPSASGTSSGSGMCPASRCGIAS